MNKSSLLILLLTGTVLIFFTSCVDDKFDLGNVSPVVSFEIDGLAIPLGSTEPILLSDFLEEDDMLWLDSIQHYSINIADDIDPINETIDPIEIDIGSIDIEPLLVDFDADNVSDFSFDGMSSISELDMPDVNIAEDIDLPVVFNALEEEYNLPVPITFPGIPIQETVPLGPEEIDVAFEYALSENEEIETIHIIYFGESDEGQILNFYVDYSDINAIIDGPQSTQTINYLEITFPDDFELAKNHDCPFADNASIVGGNVFVINNAVLDNNSDLAIFSFYVTALTLEESDDIDYEEQIQYELEYEIDGISSGEDIYSLSLETGIDEQLHLNYATVTTALIEVDDMDPGSLTINSTIDGLEDISVIHEITFEPTSSIDIHVNDPDLPLSLSDEGSLNVVFPSIITFDLAASDLGNGTFDPFTNTLEIPASELFGAHVSLVLYKMDLSGYDIVDGEMVIEEEIVYTGTDFQFLPEQIKSTEVEGLDDALIELTVPETELSVADAEITTDVITAEVDQTVTIDVDEEVPDELIAITSLIFDENEPCEINLNISFENLPSGVEQIELRDFEISFPQFLVFDPDDNVIDGTYTVTETEGTFHPDDGFAKIFNLKEFDFSYMGGGSGLMTVTENGVNKIIIDENNTVSLLGEVVIEDATFSGDEIEGIVITPELFLDEFVVSKLSGTVDLDIEPIDQSIDFDGLDESLDFLTDDASLGLNNPQILLSVGNTIGVPFNLAINLHGEDADGEVIPGTHIDEFILNIDGAEVLGEPTMSRFLISAQGTEMGGYEPIHIPNLPNLLQEIPERISFHISAETDKSEIHVIDLSKDLEITVEYELIIPLQFDELNLNYQHTITDLKDAIGDIDEEIIALGLALGTNVENAIPFEFNFEAIPVDKSGNIMSDLTISVSEIIPAGSLDETAMEGISVLFEATDGAIKDLDEIRLNVNVSTNETVGGIPLNANQFMQLHDISLFIDANLEFNLNGE